MKLETYGHRQGEFSESISFHYAKEYRKPANTGKEFKVKYPDGICIDNGFSKALEIKYFGGISIDARILDRLITESNHQLDRYDYKVLHIHTLNKTINTIKFINRLKRKSRADLIVLFFGGEPVKTIFLPRR